MSPKAILRPPQHVPLQTNADHGSAHGSVSNLANESTVNQHSSLRGKSGETTSRATTPISHVLNFAAFQLDLENERLSRDGEVIRLQPKAFAMLRYLAERPHRLITKTELLESLWGGVCVSDSVLKTQLNHIRLALQDDAKAPRLIETIHRRGYCFVGAVEAQAISNPEKVRPRFDPNAMPRHASQTRLEQALCARPSAERCTIFVTGEAGIGKTSLLDSVLAGVRGRRIARGHCVEHHGSVEPYLPVVEALTRSCREPGGEQIAEILRKGAPCWAARMPELTNGQFGDLPDASSGGGERMLREMAMVLPILTREIPLLLVLEDLQWADLCTLELMARLARNRDPANVLILGTYRPQELAAATHPLLALKQMLDSRQQCDHIPLEPLSNDEVSEYLHQRFPRHDFPDELAEVIRVRTAGNPLFVARLMDDLVQTGKIYRGLRERFQLACALEAVGSTVPSSITALVERDVARLDEVPRSVLEAASVSSVEFSLDMLAAVAGRRLVDVEDLCLQWARSNRFFRMQRTEERSERSVGVTFRFRFIHPLYRQVIFDAIGPARLAELQQRLDRWAQRARLPTVPFGIKPVSERNTARVKHCR